MCDCPGLVFPSFSSSKSELILHGVLPIDTLRDYLTPLSLVMLSVKKEILELKYKITLPEKNSNKYTASNLLKLFASKKGYVTGRGLPNEA